MNDRKQNRSMLKSPINREKEGRCCMETCQAAG